MVAPIVAGDVLGHLRREEQVARKFGQAALDVTGGSGLVAGENVAEVSLTLDEVALVGQRDDGILDGRIAVRVIVHRVADHAGHLGEAPVILLPHRVENAALDGLEAVLHRRQGAVADGIGGELQEVFVHQPPEGSARRDGDIGQGDGLGCGCGNLGLRRRAGGFGFRVVWRRIEERGLLIQGEIRQIRR